MSAETVAWVFRYSPYSGTPFSIHLAIADSVSDMHEFKFWMNPKKTAVKARTSRQTVATTLRVMARDGFLELLEDGSAQRKSSMYRFLMPASAAVVFDSQAKTEDLDPMAVIAGATRVRPVALSQDTTSAEDPTCRNARQDLSQDAQSLVARRDTYTNTDPKENPTPSSPQSSSTPGGDRAGQLFVVGGTTAAAPKAPKRAAKKAPSEEGQRANRILTAWFDEAKAAGTVATAVPFPALMRTVTQLCAVYDDEVIAKALRTSRAMSLTAIESEIRRHRGQGGPRVKADGRVDTRDNASGISRDGDTEIGAFL